MDCSDILRKACELTTGDRLQDYGDPADNHKRIADAFNAVTGHSLTASDVALLQVCTKLCRISTSPEKADSYVDGAAYFGIAYECQMKQAQ